MSTGMTPEQRQQFFDREGYWPCDPVKVVVKRLSTKERQQKVARGLQLSLQGRYLRGWRAPLHWVEPPLFEKPGLMYEELGHEEFLRQVGEYYESISALHCDKVHREHTRWAIKQILRNFETHVRGFRGQSVGRNGSIFGKGSGQEKWGPKFRPHYADILTMPESIGSEDGRLVNEIAAHLRNYAVPESEIAASALEVRKRLRAIWGIAL